jgi:hypothetical protein
MKLTRRKFIAAAPVAAGAILHLDVAAQAEPAPDNLSKLGYHSFLPFVGTDFSFGGIGVPEAVLRLTDIEDTRPPGPMRRRSGECFALTFSGPANVPLVQGTYEVNHFNLADFSLFISVGRRVQNQISYYAVINRHMPSAGTATA